MNVFRVYHNVRCAMIECLHHLTFIERHPFPLTFTPETQTRGIRTLAFEPLRVQKR